MHDYGNKDKAYLKLFEKSDIHYSLISLSGDTIQIPPPFVPWAMKGEITFFRHNPTFLWVFLPCVNCLSFINLLLLIGKSLIILLYIFRDNLLRTGHKSSYAAKRMVLPAG